jgi:hypothetical protein
MSISSYQDNYNLLLQKLRDFKRKYYRNEILKGVIYFSATFLLSYLLVTVLEYFGRFDSIVRAVLFYAFLGTNLFILTRYIIIPLLSLLELRKSLSETQAAQIIGRHFGEVQDKLLNTLQLHEQANAESDSFQKQLILASINQKTLELRPVPFVRAVDYRGNRRYLKYALVPLAVLLILLLQAPHMLLQSTQRLVSYNKYFEAEAPFKFIIKNDSLRAVRQQDYTVNVEVKGSELPAEVYLVVDGNPFKMNVLSKTHFSYTFRNLQKDLTFEFNANGFSSRPYELKVLPKPVLQKFDVHLQYPAYLGKKSEILQNVGDLTIPAGTQVTWKFYTENAEQLTLGFPGKAVKSTRESENLYSYSAHFLKDDSYYLKIGNRYMRDADSIQYQVNVIPDAYPNIKVEQEQDSTHLKNIYFTGEISDDYGFSRLLFKYHFTKSEDSAKIHMAEKAQSLPISSSKLLQPFYHYFDMSALNIQPGDEVEYYFEVWDNDGVAGSKSTRSQKLSFKAPSEKEIEQNTETANKELTDKMESAMKQASQLQKDIQDAKMRMMNKRNLEWQDKKALNEMLQKQENLEKTVEDIQKQYNQNLQEQNEFKKMDEEMLEKHKELQDMLNQIMDPETKKLFDELKKMLDQNNKDEIQKQLDQMKFNDKEVQKELDRMKDLFKQLEFQQKLQETIDKLDKLADKQDKLSKETEQKDKDSKTAEDKKKASDELQQKQKDLNDKFEDVKKDLGDLQKKNEELQHKNDMQQNQEQQQEIQQEMQKSQENLQNQQNKKASQNQKSAADKMKQMSKKMQEMQQQMKDKETELDYQALRQILENLVRVSFEQEDLMDQFKAVSQYNPHYVELAQKQRKLKDDAKMIEDSLFSLSKRVPEIKSFVNKEIGNVNFNMDNALEQFGDRQTARGRSYQQFAMTSLNNLALMLDEVMQQLQQKMQESSKAGQCNKPKKSGPSSMKAMKEMQKKLNDQLKEMQSELQKQEQQGKSKKQGEKMSKELAEAAAQQELLRRELQRMNEQRNKDGKKSLGDLDKMQQEMNKTEEDLVNKRITDETLKRQQDIMVRMLESEKAEKQQEFDEQRESRTAQDKNNPTPPALEKYIKMKEKEVELLHTVPPGLNSYYREKVKQYFQDLKN